MSFSTTFQLLLHFCSNVSTAGFFIGCTAVIFMLFIPTLLPNRLDGTGPNTINWLPPQLYLITVSFTLTPISFAITGHLAINIKNILLFSLNPSKFP